MIRLENFMKVSYLLSFTLIFLLDTSKHVVIYSTIQLASFWLFFFVGSLVEEKLNFTSTAPPLMEDVTKIESDAKYEAEKDIEREAAGEQSEDDLQMMDEANAAQSMTQVEREEVNGRRAEEVNARKTAAGSRRKPRNSPKKRNADGVVQVMERLVQIKEKEANKEAAQDFTINRCMDAFKTLEGVTVDDKILALEVFKNADNHEIFVNLVADKDGIAIPWLRAQIAKLT